jgi:hypothetical protein
LDIKEFAEKHRLKTKTDSCGDSIIPGKAFCRDATDKAKKRIAQGVKREPKEYSSHLYDGFSDGWLGLCLMFPHRRRWNAAYRLATSAGFTLRQTGESGGCWKFDPENPAHVKLVLSLAGIKPKRIATPTQVAALAKARLKQSAPLSNASLNGDVATQQPELVPEAA